MSNQMPLSHYKDHFELSLTLVVLQSYPLGNYRFFICILFSHVIKPLLKGRHLQDLVPMSEINLKFFHMVHHLQQPSDQGLHFGVKFSRFERNKSVLCVLSFIKSQHFAIKFLVLFGQPVPVFFFYPKKLHYCFPWHFEPKKLFGVFLLVIPSRHFQPKTLIIYLRHPCVLQKLSKTLFYFKNIGLSLRKSPLCELQADFLKIDVTQFIDQAQDGIEVFKGYIVDMCSMKPKTLDAFLCVLNDVIANSLQQLVLRHFEATQINLDYLDMFACGQNSSNVAEEVIENLFFGEMPISQALQFDI